VQGYKVYYTLTPDLPIPQWTTQVVEGSRLTTIQNLRTSRTYTVRVRALTDVGDGLLSDPIQVKLQQEGIVVTSSNNLKSTSFTHMVRLFRSGDICDQVGELSEICPTLRCFGAAKSTWVGAPNF